MDDINKSSTTSIHVQYNIIAVKKTKDFNTKMIVVSALFIKNMNGFNERPTHHTAHPKFIKIGLKLIDDMQHVFHFTMFFFISVDIDHAKVEVISLCPSQSI